MARLLPAILHAPEARARAVHAQPHQARLGLILLNLFFRFRVYFHELLNFIVNIFLLSRFRLHLCRVHQQREKRPCDQRRKQHSRNVVALGKAP